MRVGKAAADLRILAEQAPRRQTDYRIPRQTVNCGVMITTQRIAAISALAWHLFLATTCLAATADGFVRVEGDGFVLRGEPYRFVGTNLWYAAYLGRQDSEGGDRERVRRELDLLASLGVTNLRLLGASERSPLDNSMSPAISYRGRVENENILQGLDYFLAEMGRRDMKAVIFLNNFWEWSGGMVTYLSWVNGGEFVNLGDPAHPWPEFAWFSARFYSNPEAQALYLHYLAALLQRHNSVTGVPYRDDPTIMSWQLANEPRPGDGEASRPNLPAYYAWIRDTAALIHRLAPNQLVSLGSEGTMGCLELDECFLAAHGITGIDYATFHLWPKNWGWYDARQPQQTFDRTLERTEAYISRHVRLAQQLGLPLVLEEFGIERDSGEVSPKASTSYRDRFLRFVFQRIESSASTGGPLTGSNYWAWGGFGQARHADAAWRPGDLGFVGDPPQEPQGLNSIFASDTGTLEILRRHAAKLGGRPAD